jgi:hypothetical protein
MQKVRIIGFFFENTLHWQVKVGKQFLQTAAFRLHIYLLTKGILMYNFLLVVDNWDKV